MFPWKAVFERGARLRVEVGYVNGEELYSRPGGKALSESDLSRLISGTVSTGDFVIAASNLFNSRSAEIVAAGVEVRTFRHLDADDLREQLRRQAGLFGCADVAGSILAAALGAAGQEHPGCA